MQVGDVGQKFGPTGAGPAHMTSLVIQVVVVGAVPHVPVGFTVGCTGHVVPVVAQLSGILHPLTMSPGHNTEPVGQYIGQ